MMPEARLPHGFEPVERGWPPDLPSDEIVRIEIVDAAGRVRPWQWSDLTIPWHEAAGWRVAPDGRVIPCDVCGRLTRRGYIRNRLHEAVENNDPEFMPLCEQCDAGGYDG